MSDPDSAGKKGSAPAWQKQAATPEISSDGAESSENHEPQSEDATSRATIIEQAKKFLLEEDVRDAPTDQKIRFLESKGLENSEIQELLGVSRNQEASGSEVCRAMNSIRQTYN
jgi:hypothetical protein